jgi:hypothetical protein
MSNPKKQPTEAGSQLRLLFDPEDRGNVPPKHRALSELHDFTTRNTVLFSHLPREPQIQHWIAATEVT